MKRLTGLILSLAVSIPLSAETSLSKRTPYLPVLQRYLELTSLQLTLLMESNRVYSRYLLDQERQMEDARSSRSDPRYRQWPDTWSETVAEACEGVRGFAAEIREHNTRILDASQRADLDYLLTTMSESVLDRDAILEEARAANLLALPAIIDHVTENVSSECRGKWAK